MYKPTEYWRPEARAAFAEVRDYIFANLPPGALHEAIELIDLRRTKSIEPFQRQPRRTDRRAVLSSSLAFSILFIVGVMIRQRLREQ